MTIGIGKQHKNTNYSAYIYTHFQNKWPSIWLGSKNIFKIWYAPVICDVLHNSCFGLGLPIWLNVILSFDLVKWCTSHYRTLCWRYSQLGNDDAHEANTCYSQRILNIVNELMLLWLCLCLCLCICCSRFTSNLKLIQTENMFIFYHFWFKIRSVFVLSFCWRARWRLFRILV